jgi:hypothetical protein
MKKFRALPSIPRLILAVTAFLLAMGLGAGIAWWRTGHAAIIRVFFQYPGAIFIVGASAAELWLCCYCWRQFSRGEIMRRAWFLIMLAAGAHFTGMVFSQFLGVDSYLNPIMYCDVPWVDTAAEHFRQIGILIGGPLQMALLACGLALVLRTYRRAGLLPRLSSSDWFLVTVLAIYTMREAWQVVYFVRAGSVVTVYEALSWPSDPLLIVLLFEAICIRRSVLGMGRGLIAKCWGAFAVGIAMTALGDIGLWATWNGYLSKPLAAASWYVWFLWSAAYALGPAYQVEAFRRVRQTAHQAAARRAAAA